MSTICDDLRAAILQAAMQGKLTRQLPEDGDAKELIEKIIHEKNSRNIKISKFPIISENEKPFELPKNWSWVRIGEVFNCTMGSSPEGSSVNKNPRNGIEFHQGKIHFTDKTIENSGEYTSKPVRIAEPNSALLCVRAPIGKVNLTDRLLCIGRGLASIEPLAEMSVDYVYYLLRSLEEVFISKGTGSTFKAIGKDIILLQVFCLPPIAEQKRIVEKVDELMARVADLEQSADALASLKKAFPDDIKASLLQAAMQGKLTKQLPEDGSAEDLLEEIKAEKEKLIAEGKIKKQKPLAPITDDEIPFSIPDNWEWVRLGDITYNRGQKKPEKLFSYIDVGTLNNIDHKLNDEEQIVEPEKASSRARKIVHKGDVIYATIRPYLHNICIIDRDFSEEPIASTAFAVMSPYTGINNKYLFQTLLSPGFDNYANRTDLSKGVAYPAIGEKDFFNGIIPLPPLAEQKRIVERLDSLIQNINVVRDLIASE